MKKFRTLDVAIKFYKIAKEHKLPNRHLQDQFNRALLSVVLNLSEGNAKPTRKDRRKFFYISYGSFREVQTLLKLTDERVLLQGSDSLGAHLYKLCKRV
jgi:four helix bundle protein